MGVDSCSDKAYQLWTADEYRFAPYQYEEKNLVFQLPTRSWQPASTRTRELLLGFRPGHTEVAGLANKWKLQDRRSMHVRDSLLGNSMHCPTVSLVMASTLTAWKLLPAIPHSGALLDMRPTGEDGRPLKEEMRLARMYHSYQTHGGGELRNESGPRRSLSKPSWQSVSASQWRWRTVLSCT